MEDLLLSIYIKEKKFKDHVVIENISLQIFESDKIAIFAPSGSGKSTLIKIIANIDKNFSGTIEKFYKTSSFLLQEAPLFWYKNIKENIFYPLKFYNINKDKLEKINNDYEEWLKITGLKNFEKHFPYEISGGMKQKVNLIRTFLFEPQIVFLDEPFTFLDIKSKNLIMNFIKEKYKNITIFMVTHNIDELPDFLKKIFLFKDLKLSNYKTIKIEPFYKREDIINLIFKE
jgi:ABC-type nitrate/sulfonate/bicarbonate transport system ATPase subunit